MYCTAIFYLVFPGFFEGISQMWNHKSYLLFIVILKKKHILKGSLVRKRHCIMIRDRLRTLSNTNELLYCSCYCFFNRVLNTPLMMTVARYWESFSSKTKILFSVISKKDTINIYSWQYGSTYNMNVGLNEKKISSCLKHQTEKTTAVEWNEDMNI